MEKNLNEAIDKLKEMLSDNLRDNNHKGKIIEQFDSMLNLTMVFDSELRRYYAEIDKMKEALFHRNTMIQDLDQEVQTLQEKNDDLETELHLIESKLRSKNIDIEVLNDALTSLKLKYNECVRNSIM